MNANCDNLKVFMPLGSVSFFFCFSISVVMFITAKSVPTAKGDQYINIEENRIRKNCTDSYSIIKISDKWSSL